MEDGTAIDSNIDDLQNTHVYIRRCTINYIILTMIVSQVNEVVHRLVSVPGS